MKPRSFKVHVHHSDPPSSDGERDRYVRGDCAFAGSALERVYSNAHSHSVSSTLLLVPERRRGCQLVPYGSEEIGRLDLVDGLHHFLGLKCYREAFPPWNKPPRYESDQCAHWSKYCHDKRRTNCESDRTGRCRTIVPAGVSGLPCRDNDLPGAYWGSAWYLERCYVTSRAIR